MRRSIVKIEQIVDVENLKQICVNADDWPVIFPNLVQFEPCNSEIPPLGEGSLKHAS